MVAMLDRRIVRPSHKSEPVALAIEAYDLALAGLLEADRAMIAGPGDRALEDLESLACGRFVEVMGVLGRFLADRPGMTYRMGSRIYRVLEDDPMVVVVDAIPST